MSTDYWYSYFTIGGTLLLGYLNHVLNSTGVIQKLKINYVLIIRQYVLFLAVGILIEIVGQHMLNFWSYPSYNLFEKFLNVYLIGYPFAFFLIFETFLFINKYIRLFIPAFIFTYVVSVLAHEIPNLYAREWVYHVSRITQNFLGTNIIVILGWPLLVIIPIIVNKKIKIEK